MILRRFEVEPRLRIAVAAGCCLVSFAGVASAAEATPQESTVQQGGATQPATTAQPAAESADTKALWNMIRRLNQRIELLEARPVPPPPEPPAPVSVPGSPHSEPFAFADFTWMLGQSRQTEFPLAGKYVSAEFSLEGGYAYELSNPSDHSVVGSTAVGRHNEFQLTHIGVGADFSYHGARGRIMTQLGMYATMTPRNDASPGRGQWNIQDAYRYVTEAYGGYHWNVNHGLNVDAGIFLSYVGLSSYYDYENWITQSSYVSSNTPWFFNGIRVQYFPTEKVKLELWVINGWQSYGEFNEMPGLGLQVAYRPREWLAMVESVYFGKDVLGNSARTRYHSDGSIQARYYDSPSSPISKGAISLTADLGCEDGGGVSCANGSAAAPSQFFAAFMLYNRNWFWHNKLALTEGGGVMDNPGRYLVLMPPINGATAFSGTPYFSFNPGDQYWAWDTTESFDYMPSEHVTLRLEYTHRWASVPYFAGPNGVTPPGGNTGTPGSMVPGFTPDLQQNEDRFQLSLMIRI